MSQFDQTDLLAINTIRMLAVDATRKAGCGHPGMPMGMAPTAYVLFSRFLKFSPSSPDWLNRDRFVLSAGHGSMLLYALLHLYGYDLSLDEIKNFRQWNSKTPGHPEYGHTVGVETTTGPLGQGLATAVGMAMGERNLATRINEMGYPIIDHNTWVIASDGDLMEGISHETCSMAGHLKLGRLKVIYDDNHITIEGNTDLTFSENIHKRFEAYGWHVQFVEDGNDLVSIEKALAQANMEHDKPSLIAIQTHIGYGSPLQDSPKVHGSALSPEQIQSTKTFLNWPQEPTFYIPEDVKQRCRTAIERGKAWVNQWQQILNKFTVEFPQKALLLEQALKHNLPSDLDKKIPLFPPDPKGTATRISSGHVINMLAKELPFFMGGSADLAGSTMTLIENDVDFSAHNYQGRNFHFGIREHGMAAVLNGMALHGGILPFGATFLMFADYLKPALRLSHLMHLPVIYVFTHDSIGQGEDGPTHQPVETLASLRSIPHATVIRPCDANEVAVAWQYAIQNKNNPTILVFSRQNVPTLDRSNYAPASALFHGLYILSESSTAMPQVILIGTGSEMGLCLEAQKKLESQNISTRVVSAPSLEIFKQQPLDYQKKVLPPSIKARVAVEAASSFGWHSIIGECGSTICLDRFGASAPGPVVMTQLGFTAEKVVEAALTSLKKSQNLNA
jgi:transketolase